MRPLRKSPETQPPRSRSAGFTLVELLIVITILGILIAFLVPAVMSAMTNVRTAQVKTEVNLLASAVTNFKAKYNVDPPSAIILCEQASAWASNPRGRAYIRQMWPQFDFTLNRDLNGDGDSNDLITLTGGECLVFFLGGMLDRSGGANITQSTPTGFSKNPANPFALGGNREKATYDFQTSRFTDLNSNGFPEYRDPLPGQRSPYLYYSSYDGSGYRFAPPINEYTGGTNPNGGVFPSSPYLQGTTQTSPAYNPKTFQIISPGQDGQYGPGGPYDPNNLNAALPAWTRTTPALTVTAQDRLVEFDNITNFSNGRLVP